MGSPSGFSARLERQNGVARLALDGELDIDTVPVLKERLAEIDQREAEATMLDLRGLTFIDSSGLAVILQAWKAAQANGHRLFLVGASPAARRLFAITGTEFLVDQEEAAGGWAS